MKEEMLYLVPVIPNPTGGGREMRSYGWIMHLSAIYSVHLVIAAKEQVLPELLTDKTASVHFIHPYIESKGKKIQRFFRFALRIIKLPPVPHSLNSETENLQRLAGLLKQYRFKKMLIFRMGMIEIGMQLSNLLNPERIELDTDDIESLTQFSIAKIRFLNLHFLSALKEYIRSWLFFFAEIASLSEFDCVYVCSDTDQQILSEKYRLENAGVFPNKILFTECVPTEKHLLPVFLFVGSFGYFPNEDAALYLINHVLPGLKKRMTGRFKIIVAGRNASERLVRKLGRHKEIDFRGEVADLAEVYRDADYAIIPLRAGGGTKLKVLEAFLNRKAVIASFEAVRGLNIRNGEHYLLASSAEEFIEACCRLSRDQGLRNKLQNNAYDCVLDNLVYHNNQR